MKKTMYVCDRCGKSATDLVLKPVSPKNSAKELCPACWDEYNAWIEQYFGARK